MIRIGIQESAGVFADNKDVARDLREQTILPALEKGQEVQLDFFGVDATTQSFVHALISEAFRRYGPEVLDRLIFKNCNEVVRGAVVLVAEYMQESLS